MNKYKVLFFDLVDMNYTSSFSVGNSPVDALKESLILSGYSIAKTLPGFKTQDANHIRTVFKSDMFEVFVYPVVS